MTIKQLEQIFNEYKDTTDKRIQLLEDNNTKLINMISVISSKLVELTNKYNEFQEDENVISNNFDNIYQNIDSLNNKIEQSNYNFVDLSDKSQPKRLQTLQYLIEDIQHIISNIEIS